MRCYTYPLVLVYYLCPEAWLVLVLSPRPRRTCSALGSAQSSLRRGPLCKGMQLLMPFLSSPSRDTSDRSLPCILLYRVNVFASGMGPTRACASRIFGGLRLLLGRPCMQLCFIGEHPSCLWAAQPIPPLSAVAQNPEACRTRRSESATGELLVCSGSV